MPLYCQMNKEQPSRRQVVYCPSSFVSCLGSYCFVFFFLQKKGKRIGTVVFHIIFLLLACWFCWFYPLLLLLVQLECWYLKEDIRRPEKKKKKRTLGKCVVSLFFFRLLFLFYFSSVVWCVFVSLVLWGPPCLRVKKLVLYDGPPTRFV